MRVAHGLLAGLLLASFDQSAHAVLQGRDLDPSRAGFEAYYDSVQDVTWLADANAARTSGSSTSGMLSFAAALSWAASLNVNGVTGWRLPTVSPIDVTACVPTSQPSDCGRNPVAERSELVHLLVHGLGLQGIFTDAKDSLLQYGPPEAGVTGYDVPGVDPGVMVRHVGMVYWVAGVYREALPCPDGAVCNVEGVTVPPASPEGGYWTPDGKTYFRCDDAATCLQAGPGGNPTLPSPPAGYYYGSVPSVWPWYVDPPTMEQWPAGERSVALAWAVHSGDVAAVPEPGR